MKEKVKGKIDCINSGKRTKTIPFRLFFNRQQCSLYNVTNDAEYVKMEKKPNIKSNNNAQVERMITESKEGLVIRE